eukprot:COSAG06_NODE_17049_length_965_cov_0.751732_1_plen_33_part_10
MRRQRTQRKPNHIPSLRIPPTTSPLADSKPMYR